MARQAQRRTPTTDDWQQFKLLVGTPGQRVYAVIRPVLLFGQPPAVGAVETATHLRAVQRSLASFETTG